MDAFDKEISKSKRWIGAEFITGLCFAIFMIVDGFDPLSMDIVVITSFQLMRISGSSGHSFQYHPATCFGIIRPPMVA